MKTSKKLQQILLTLALFVLFSSEASADVREVFDYTNKTITDYYSSLKGDNDTLQNNALMASQNYSDWTFDMQPSTGAGGSSSAPEIDASSGTSAITLLSGVLILALKRSRSRKDTKS